MTMSVENGLAPGWTGFLFVCYLFLVFCLEKKTENACGLHRLGTSSPPLCSVIFILVLI